MYFVTRHFYNLRSRIHQCIFFRCRLRPLLARKGRGEESRGGPHTSNSCRRTCISVTIFPCHLIIRGILTFCCFEGQLTIGNIAFLSRFVESIVSLHSQCGRDTVVSIVSCRCTYSCPETTRGKITRYNSRFCAAAFAIWTSALHVLHVSWARCYTASAQSEIITMCVGSGLVLVKALT